MNPRSRLPLHGMGKRVSLFVVLLLTGLSLEAVTPRRELIPLTLGQRKSREDQNGKQSTHVPYLRNTIATSLRVAETTAPPAFEIEPLAAGPAWIPEQGPPPVVAKSRAEMAPVDVSDRKHEIQMDSQKAQEEEQPAILPDDLRREVRPEDVIPFFLFPGEGGGATVGVVVPVPQQAPAPRVQVQQSTATYTQQ